MTNEIKTWQERGNWPADFAPGYDGMPAWEAAKAEIAELRAKVESLAADAERWQLARKFLAVEDIEASSTSEWRGHQPNEEESEKADKIIDAMAKEKA